MNLAKVRGVLTCLLFLTATAAEAQVERFVEGVHYQRLSDTRAAYDLGAPEGRQSVLEVFWFGCGHCYAFDPLLNHWVEDRPAVQFARSPVIWNGTTREHARLFFTTRLLGLEAKMHDRVFNEIHEKKNYLLDAESVGELFTEFGVDEERFEKTYASFSVDTELRKTETAQRELKLEGVPALIVNGEFLVTNTDAVPTHQMMLDVTEFLLDRES